MWKPRAIILCIFSGINPIVMYLWGEKSAPALYFLNFGYSFGAVISAQIARPFLTRVSSNGYGATDIMVFDNVTATSAYVMTTISVNASEVVETSGRLFYPYSVASVFTVLMGISLAIIHTMGLLTVFLNGNTGRNSVTFYRPVPAPTDVNSMALVFFSFCSFLMFLPGVAKKRMETTSFHMQ